MLEDSFQTCFEAGEIIMAVNRKFASPLESPYGLNFLLEGIGIEKAEIIFHSPKEPDENDGADLFLISLKKKEPSAVMEAVTKLSDNPYVLFAEPDYPEELHLISNDPLYSFLWGTQRVDAPSAWEYTTGSAEVTVGVIDSGIDAAHPDIRNNMWVSPDRRLANGWNFAENNRNSTDTNGHGTHVAGTIGAVGNNGIGITGICWNIKIAALRFGLNTASAVAAIDFANRFDIPILNASWGGPFYSRALKYAIDHYNGLFIASAGNDGANNDLEPMFPASFDSANLISVAAANPNNELAGFSNYGARSVDIAAPGTNILSLGLYGSYSPQNGTSMAAPHVAGAAALLKSYFPGLSPLALKSIILSSAVRHKSLAGRVVTGGLLNANAMFRLASFLLER